MNRKNHIGYFICFFYLNCFYFIISYTGKNAAEAINKSENAAEMHKRVYGGKKRSKNITLPVIPDIYCADLIKVIKKNHWSISWKRQCNQYVQFPHQFEKDFINLFDSAKRLIYWRTLQIVHELQNGEAYDLEIIINAMKKNHEITQNAAYSLDRLFRNIQTHIKTNCSDTTATALLLNKIDHDIKEICRS